MVLIVALILLKSYKWSKLISGIHNRIMKYVKGSLLKRICSWLQLRLEHCIHLCMDTWFYHFQHIIWPFAVSQRLTYVSTFNCQKCINSDFYFSKSGGTSGGIALCSNTKGPFCNKFYKIHIVRLHYNEMLSKIPM